MYTYPWYHWITFFYIYCFFGWVFESAYVSLKTRRFVNRGFLRLPMLPLYGTGAVMMLWVSLPVKDNLVLVYFSGVVAATVLEYVTGYMMERLFKMKYWDYSSQRFQINGYICLTSSIAWGFLTIFLTEVIHRPIAEFVLGMNPFTEFFLLIAVSIVFAADAIQSTREALALGRALEAMTRMKGQLDEMHLQLALLRAEASQKLEDMKSDARLQAAGLRADAHVRMEELKTDAWLRVEELKTETSALAAELRDNTLQRAGELREDTSQLAAKLKDSVRQQTAKWEGRPARQSSGLKDSACQHIPGSGEEAAADVALPENEPHLRTAQRMKLLSQQAASLRDSRRKLSSHMSFYCRGLLMGNPTASSKKFAEALEELREMLKNKSDIQ